MTSERRAVVLMLAFVALWAIVETLAAGILKSYSPWQVVWTRYAVHLALMLAIWGWREPATLWRSPRPGYQLARSMLMLGMPAFWILGAQAGHGFVMAFFWIAPLAILVLARIFLREAIAPALWFAGVAASAAGFLVYRPGSLPALDTLVYPVGMALCFSIYIAMTRPLRHERTRTNLFYSALGVFLVLTPAMPGVWTTPGATDFAVFVAVGILGYLCLLALDRACAAAPVSLTAPATAGFLAVSIPVGAILGHAPIGKGALAGLALTAVALILVWARTAPRAHSTTISEAA